jgi:plasmid stability protein
MEQALVRKLKPGTLAAYRSAARAKGLSLEAELRAVLEANQPMLAKDCEALLRISDEALAMTLPDGPDGSDSTLLIRWDRDTNHGKWIDDGWGDNGVRR